MKVSVNWLKEYTSIDMPIDDLVEKIGSQLGAVEEVIHYGKKYEGIVVAKVVECIKHPNADKLSLCRIDDGKKVKNVERDEDGLVQVVCGAPNVKAGMLVAWLPPGSTVPVSYDKEPLVLEAREIRGKVSNGMLASASELAISDDHSGIVELTFGEPGDDFAENIGVTDDYIIDIENKMFTHRPDCFGIYGVAREVAGITGQKFTSGERYTKNPQPPETESKLAVQVMNNIPNLVPRFTAQVIENIHVKPSSIWLQARLNYAGIRPVNNVVDVTNYTMLVTAQPLHAYDYDKLCKVAGIDTAQLETRLSRKGDKLKLLNGKTITFEDDETILVTSNDVPVGIGGVMGGADTEVDETTRTVVLEAANFDMYAIRRASMRHGLFTEAVTRFSKGQSPLQCLTALYSGAGWIQHQAGGKIGPATDEYQKLHRPIAVHVTDQFITERLGLDLSKKEMSTLLTNVEFDVAINGPTLAVTPPFWRTDITIPEDVVEEIGRLYGFDRLSLELPQRSIYPASDNKLLSLKQSVRKILSAAGANELYLYSFVHGDLLETAGQDKKKAFRLSNAISPDLQYYRLSLTPSLLDKVHANIKAGHEEFVIYELGKTHDKNHRDPEEPDLPKEFQKLAVVIAADDKLKKHGAAYFHARQYAELLADKLHLRFEYHPLNKGQSSQAAQPFDAERSAEIMLPNGKSVGVIGEFNASVRRSLKLPTYCAGYELLLEELLDAAGSQTYRPLSKFPSLSQDICLRSTTDIPFSRIKSIVQEALQDVPESIELIPLDIYQKEDSGKKQTTFRVTVTSHERTLTDSYVSGLLDRVADYSAKQLRLQRV